MMIAIRIRGVPNQGWPRKVTGIRVGGLVTAEWCPSLQRLRTEGAGGTGKRKAQLGWSCGCSVLRQSQAWGQDLRVVSGLKA